MKIILDAMGGDYAPQQQVLGGCMAAEQMGIDMVLCGDQAAIKKELDAYNGSKAHISVRHCTERIENEDDPIRSVRRKKDASLVVGLQMLKDKEGDAFVCSGNTGALIASSTFTLGRLESVERPALTPILPSMKGPLALLDAGANTHCDPKNLVQFGIMGTYFMNKVMGVENPRVGLINIGVEEKKGTKLTKEAYPLLKQAAINFVGNIEGRNIPYGDADVLVADGFTGNVVLKLMEGMGKFISNELKNIFMKNAMTKLSSVMVQGGLKDLKRKMDYKEYGGAPLLGVDGIVIKAHGSSDARAVFNAIGQAKKAVDTNLIQLLKDNLKGSDQNRD